ncbi:hypothetical protein Q5692_18975 [Microcoleus sp. C2C3]|uniref:hypothetical protein n=1 Tax=unclassified Microcoleus TaxID=2642155 RepID=UPI002FCEA4AA
MQIDPTFDPEGNELKQQIIEQRASLKLLRVLINELDWPHKIAVAQIACNQMAGNPSNQLIQLRPIGDRFDDQLQAAFVLLGSLPLETLAEITIEILEEPRDRNE